MTKIIIILCVLFSAFSCKKTRTKPEPISVEEKIDGASLCLENRTKAYCTDASCFNKSGKWEVGVLSSGAGKSMGFVSFKPDENTTAKFIMEDGKVHTKSFNISKHVPKNFTSEDTIQFSLLEDGRIILVFDISETEFEVVGMSEEEVISWKRNAKLFKASREGDFAKVKSLIREGANPSYQIPFGATPVVMAAGGGHLDIVKYLVSKGAKIDTIDGNGYDIFYHCKEYKKVTDFLKTIKE